MKTRKKNQQTGERTASVAPSSAPPDDAMEKLDETEHKLRVVRNSSKRAAALFKQLHEDGLEFHEPPQFQIDQPVKKRGPGRPKKVQVDTDYVPKSDPPPIVDIDNTSDGEAASNSAVAKTNKKKAKDGNKGKKRKREVSSESESGKWLLLLQSHDPC